MHQDAFGNFVIARTEWVPAYFPVLERQTMGLLRAIKWVKELNLHYVSVELDCHVVVNNVKDRKNVISEFGVVIRTCMIFYFIL